MSNDSEPSAKIVDDAIKTYLPLNVRRALMFIGIVLVIGISLSQTVGCYNKIVMKDVAADQAFSNVQTSLEQRADLIPNYASTVAGSAGFEKSTLTMVIQARADALQIKQQIATAKTPEEIDAQQNSLAGVIGRLMLLYEQYPALKSTDQFIKLEDQLTATEKQIRDDRVAYNKAARDYNEYVRTIPAVIVAHFAGFYPEKHPMFKVTEGKDAVPVVTFNF